LKATLDTRLGNLRSADVCAVRDAPVAESHLLCLFNFAWRIAKNYHRVSRDILPLVSGKPIIVKAGDRALRTILSALAWYDFNLVEIRRL